MKKALLPFLSVLIGFMSLLILSGCPGNTYEDLPPAPSAVHQPSGFIISNNHFYLNSADFRLKCIGMEAFMPGEAPGDGDYPDNLDYAYALAKIKQANANAVYLLTGDPANLQPALFQEAKKQGVYIVLGIWFNAEGDDYIHHEYDFQGPYYKAYVSNLIRQFVDKFHNINGTNYSSQILYLVLGNELITGSVNATTAAHPSLTSYSGTFVRISNSTATECFLAEMMDYMKTYEAKNYGETHYVTHHNWRNDVANLPLTNRFLDIISFNLYSYWPSYVSAHMPGSGGGTPYKGALEEIASIYTNLPFVVSEFGISVAPSNVTTGTNETGQSNEIYNRWYDMTTANRYIAGCSIHQLFDQWWKDDYTAPAPVGVDKNEHDMTDREEYFGIIAVEGTVASPVFTERPAYYMVSNMFQ